MSRYPDEIKRKKIIEISMEAFGRSGYRVTTIKEIADKVGISPGSIYTYFKDKGQLFHAAINATWEIFFERIQLAMDNQDKSYPDRFFYALDSGLGLLSRARALLVSMLQVASRKKMLQEHIDKAAEILVPFFEEGAAKGFFPQGIDRQQRIFQITIMLSGVFFQLALVEPGQFDEALDKIRISVREEFFRDFALPTRALLP